jgi:hypothetical protein
MRAAGHDPTTTKEAQRRRSQTAMRQRLAIVAWQDDSSLSKVDFGRDIFPKLQSPSVRAIAEAMGSSISHGSKVRNGPFDTAQTPLESNAETSRRTLECSRRRFLP